MNHSLFDIEDGRVTFHRPVSFDELRKLIRNWSRVAYLSEDSGVFHVLDGCGRSTPTPATIFDAHAQNYVICDECARATHAPGSAATHPVGTESASLKWLTSFLSSSSHAMR
jgi:hypothetical protein